MKNQSQKASGDDNQEPDNNGPYAIPFIANNEEEIKWIKHDKKDFTYDYAT